MSNFMQLNLDLGLEYKEEPEQLNLDFGEYDPREKKIQVYEVTVGRYKCVTYTMDYKKLITTGRIAKIKEHNPRVRILEYFTTANAANKYIRSLKDRGLKWEQFLGLIEVGEPVHDL